MVERAFRMEHGLDLVRASVRLAQLFASDVAAFELHGDPTDESLHPAEASAIARAVPKRRREFTGGRICARAAMAALGVADAALPAGENRYPAWPDGIVGSITHTEGFCGAVAAHATSFRGLGVDVERRGVVGANVWPRICNEDELRWLQALSPERQAIASALLFSAKEAFYKAQYTITRSWLSFHDAVFQMDDDGFTVRLLSENPAVAAVPREVRGRYYVDPGLVFTGVAL